MSNTFIISGTDTGIGKTAVAAMLTLALGGVYWKPLQSGMEDGGDTRAVRAMSGLPDERFLPEAYVFSQPLSPHRAAEMDGVEIDARTLKVPEVDAPLIIEGAGGLMVPVTREHLLIDVFKYWNVHAFLPVILVARTGLGTINHTLLSLEALAHRAIPVHGVVFVGDENADNMRTIGDFSKVKILGRLPMVDVLNAQALRDVFEAHFDMRDFV